MKGGSAKKKKPLKQPCLSAYCAILPSASPTLSEEVFSVTENSVNCPDAKFENTFNYRFLNVYNGLRELQGAFDKSYAPLVRQTIAGESTLIAFSGLPLSDSMEYFTSMNGHAGIINMASQLLLRAACTDAKKPGTVTLSWYRIDCGPSEAITDLLRSSSSMQAQRGPDPNLVLRELGKGRGMIVPGLWEVELTTPQDADAVINHVQKMIPSCIHDGKSHSIFQLTISPFDQQQKANYTHVGSKATIIDDSPGVGRLTIALLSDLGPVKNASYIESLAPQVVERFDWVNQMYDILHWMESRRPSPPFHKSRVLLLLRDALCSRMHGAITLFLVPSVQSLPDNSSWLDLVSKIYHTSDERLSAINAVNAAAKALTDAQTQELLAAAAAANIPPPGRFSQLHDESTRTRSLKKTTPSRSRLEESVVANHQQGKAAWGLEDRGLMDDNAKYRSNRSDLYYSVNDEVKMSGPDAELSYRSDADEEGSPPTARRHLQYHQAKDDSHHRQYSSESRSHSDNDYDECVLTERMVGESNVRQGEHYKQTEIPVLQGGPLVNAVQPTTHQQPLHSHGRYEGEQQFEKYRHHHRHDKVGDEPQGVVMQELPEGALDPEGARALIAALEASRSEVVSLRQALMVAQQSSEYYLTEYEKLSRHKHEEGSSLKAEDRARFKKALQDLKDYEVYREVMESAMTRMQQEMEKIEHESIESKNIQRQLEKDIRKSKSIQNKVLQDAENNQKGRRDLSRRLELAEDKLVEAMREREAAVVALSQFKSDKGREVGELNASLHRKDVEIRNLKKKCHDAEAKLKSVTSDFAASSTIHEQEMKKIKAAHSKSLEMLMTYQEENDLLRSAMSDMLDKDGSASNEEIMKSLKKKTPGGKGDHVAGNGQSKAYAAPQSSSISADADG